MTNSNLKEILIICGGKVKVNPRGANVPLVGIPLATLTGLKILTTNAQALCWYYHNAKKVL
jgi:hypothetical protein